MVGGRAGGVKRGGVPVGTRGGRGCVGGDTLGLPDRIDLGAHWDHPRLSLEKKIMMVFVPIQGLPTRFTYSDQLIFPGLVSFGSPP